VLIYNVMHSHTASLVTIEVPVVPLMILIKLKAYGFTGNLLAWVTDFLSNRSQCVRLGNSLSQPISVLSGVPPGSVIGPTLFLLFVK